MDLGKAEEIALNEFDGQITELELDEDDGRLMYEIEIEDGEDEAEIEIDAYTGEILVIEIDREDD
ncbi:PepSY domain-containing protein [Virgibacillus natechei]|uniref:PepSY domain-containing protein n=1 Tax=Virgibacillus natechei TaxID=1216297 RepID=UPI001AEB84CE|nr:PepSY domain-containing protein [Virgibacillus natechei]UZD14853.1 PepSY domain-containing protein [Virgibacillus natechei]